MIFIRIPSFLKGMMNLYAINMLFGGCASFSSVAQRKEIEERVKAVLDGKVKTSVMSVAIKLSLVSRSPSISVEAPAVSANTNRLEKLKLFHGDLDPKRHYSGHLHATTVFNEKLLWKNRHVCGGVCSTLEIQIVF
jgi:hypothetical protein